MRLSPRLPPRLIAPLAAASIALFVAGCGESGGGGVPVASPAPEKCVTSWNDAPEGPIFGKHVYDEHAARQAEVTEMKPGRGAVNIRAKVACIVTFSVPPTDEEYGDVGLARTDFGWASMTEIDRGNTQLFQELQRSAAEAPNAVVFPDGRIEEL